MELFFGKNEVLVSIPELVQELTTEVLGPLERMSKASTSSAVADKLTQVQAGILKIQQADGEPMPEQGPRAP